VFSPEPYNRQVGLALFCAVTSQVKGYPFEVLLPPGAKVAGAVLADQVKSLDWRARGVQRIGRAPGTVTTQVLAKVLTLVR
jgi:mRNA interferase MazF